MVWRVGSHSRNKGARVEREVVRLHQAIGLEAQRVPLSGATRYQGNHEDVDVKVGAAVLRCQVKALHGPRGTKGVTQALGEADALFLRYDAEPGQHAPPPLVVLPWRTWERLLKGR